MSTGSTNDKEIQCQGFRLKGDREVQDPKELMKYLLWKTKKGHGLVCVNKLHPVSRVRRRNLVSTVAQARRKRHNSTSPRRFPEITTSISQTSMNSQDEVNTDIQPSKDTSELPREPTPTLCTQTDDSSQLSRQSSGGGWDRYSIFQRMSQYKVCKITTSDLASLPDYSYFRGAIYVLPQSCDDGRSSTSADDESSSTDDERSSMGSRSNSTGEPASEE
ncbi:hypothetical protein VNI00_016116 [Paramarasmius palmivorus]|uniref:Uncharacterized protein n=1 Tax=Paramarasmius palmivorus TaxID=297713 RepID=A0AAW0BHA3_9AGAR